MLFIVMLDSCVIKLDSFYFSLITPFQRVFFFLAVSNNCIEYSWVILDCLVHSHDFKQVLKYQYFNIRSATGTFES